jgi:hypothetical protein
MWVGVLLICASFAVTDCAPLVSPHAFSSQGKCANELAQLQNQARQQGLVTMGVCRKVKAPGQPT